MRKVGSGLDRASQAPPLSTLMAMLVFVALALRAGLAGLPRPAHRPRRRTTKRAVLTDEVVTRRRAPAPAPRRRWRRAGSRRRWSRGSAPSRSGRSSAAGCPTPRAPPRTRWPRRWPASTPRMADRVRRSARLFDEVLYGDRPATREQADVRARARRRPGGAPMTTTLDRAPVAPAVQPGPLRRHRSTHPDRRWPWSPRSPSRSCSAPAPRPRPRWTPTTPARTGTRALARVLGDEGVDVQVARGADELEAIDVDGGTSVVVVLPRVPRHQHHRAAARPHRPRRTRRRGRRRARAWPTCSARTGGGGLDPARRGPRGRLRRPAVRRADARGRLDPRLPGGRLLRRQVRRGRHRAGATGCCSSAPTRRSPTTRSCGPTTPRSRCGCSARTSGWSGTSPASTTSSATTA